ncbi:MAG: family 10 glycosylhydrolase, partial [Desulfobulbaceae bacterium]|nr:family 10 glycosylhydrolase [Desulfobulbaceae bacterium]
IFFSGSISSAQAGGRGTWVVRFDIDTPQKVKELCSQENQSQFDRFLVQVRGRADSWYESSFVPSPEGLVDFDPLAAILAECTDVEIHAWLNVYYLWTGDIPPENLNHPYYNDEWILKDRTGRSVKDYSGLEQRQRWIEGVYADPASTDYRAYFSDVVRELVENYDVAGVHLDFIRYPGAFFGAGGGTGLAKVTRQDFAQWHNKSGDAGTRAALSERIGWEQQRSDNVTNLVRDVKKTMEQVNPDLRLSASVFPDVIEAFLDKGQKWTDWLQEGLLDEVYVMAYFGSAPRIASQLLQCKQICERYKVRMWAGLGAYIKSAVDIQTEIASAKGSGVDDICLFSLGHLLKQNKAVSGYQLDGQVEAAVHGEQIIPPLVLCVLDDDFAVTTQTAHSGAPSRSISLRGIFRYVDAHDDYGNVHDQYAIMQEVQEALGQGQSFLQVSRLYSQAGTRRDGGQLPDLAYTDARTRDMQHLFALKTGEYSDILPVHNGFWLFQKVGQSLLQKD